MSARLPKEIAPIIQGMYRPDFDPQDLKLTGALALSQDDIKVVEKRVAEFEKKLLSSEVPEPLTESEAAAVEQKVDEMRDAIAKTRMRISRISSKIDLQAAPDGQAEIGFEVDLKKKGRLKRAIRKAFGSKPETLTYSMYKSALAVKREIEESEANDYTAGNLED
jgi:hypothetical protein